MKRENTPSARVGFHTGAFNSAYWSFETTVRWAAENGFSEVECGFLDGVSWNHGLGYFPHIASWEDPGEVRTMMHSAGVKLSQIDAAFPISAREGPHVAVPYIINAIRYAALLDCPMVDTTDGLFPPHGRSPTEIMEEMRRMYQTIVEIAERYGTIVTVETHGFFTSDPDRMATILGFVDSPLFGMTFDTGNVFIAGQDPAAFLKRHIDRVMHVHLKDVTPDLAARSRGKQSGIGMSHTAIGNGVNATNIRDCLVLLRDHGYSGSMSLECNAGSGPVMEQSLNWVVETLDAINYAHDLGALRPISGSAQV